MAVSLPLVTVIIPNYNKEKYIKNAIKSVIDQTYNNLEIIVIDDASTDRSREIIKYLMISNINIKHIFNESNQGVSKSRNTGIENARGEYITTLDSDDVYYPDKIEKEVTLLHGNNKAVAAFSNYKIINITDKAIGEMYLPKYVDYNYMINRKGILPRDLMYSKQTALGKLRYKEKLSLYEDWAFKLKIAKFGLLQNTNSMGIGYRQVGDGLSRKNKKEHIKTIISILWEEQKYHGNIMKTVSVFKVIYNMFYVYGLKKILRRL